MPAAAPSTPTVVIEARRGFGPVGLAEVWAYRELLYFLIWRDVKVRYKQTAIGAAWAILQPMLTMAIFALVFGHALSTPSDGVPYPIFAFTALLPWYYFAQAVTDSARSLVGDANLIQKVYFPRLVIPLAAVLRPLVDLALSFLVLLGMVAWFGIRPTWGLVLVPLVVAFAAATALGVSLWLSALNVRYRDVGHAIPFLVQTWLFVSPVAYPASVVPERWRFLYHLNPMAGVIEAFRWAVLGTPGPDLDTVMASAGLVLLMSVSGLLYFRRMERTFADVI